MNEKEALRAVLDAAVAWWAQDARDQRLKEAILKLERTTQQLRTGKHAGITDEDERA